MIKLVLFLFLLVAVLFAVQFFGDIGQIVLFYGQSKISINLWFGLSLLLLVIAIFVWIYRIFSRFFRINGILKAYWLERSHQEKQHTRTQALMYALGGEYNKACGHIDLDQKDIPMSDLILYAVWLNQNVDLQQLDKVLGRIQSAQRLPNGWVIWFRAYLLYERGQRNIACQILLDALDSGVHSPQIVKALAEYASPKVHYHQLMKHYALLDRYIESTALITLVSEGVSDQLDQHISEGDWPAVAQILGSLPSKVVKSDALKYYHLKLMVGQGKMNELVSELERLNYQGDRRILWLISSLDIAIPSKINIVNQYLELCPCQPDLLYMLSYLHAQEGDVGDTVKALESALGTSQP